MSNTVKMCSLRGIGGVLMCGKLSDTPTLKLITDFLAIYFHSIDTPNFTLLSYLLNMDTATPCRLGVEPGVRPTSVNEPLSTV